jgi:2-dehydro-3-deoxygluconokinase
MANKFIAFGEIMLRLATPGYLRFSQTTQYSATFGGSEANVAISLANYGIPAEFVTRLPKNDIGDACLMDLRKYGVGTGKIIRGGERLGIYFLETGAVSRGSKVVYDRSNSAMSEIKPGMINWDEVFAGVTWFHWTGITPAISQSAADVCMEAIQKANEMEITVSCDLNYRNNLWKYGKNANEIMPGLVAGTHIILANANHAKIMLGVKYEDDENSDEDVDSIVFEYIAKQIMDKFPNCKKVVATLRGSVNANNNSWSGLLWDGKKLYQAPTYQITHIVDRIGSGDAFMSGLIYGWLTFSDDQKALNFAVAASCLKHTVYGDVNLVTVEEVEKLMGGETSGLISR